MSGQAVTLTWVVLSVDTYTRMGREAIIRAEVMTGIAADVAGVVQVHRPTIRPIIQPDVRSNVVIHRYEASLQVAGDKDAIRDEIERLFSREGVIHADADVAEF